MDVNSANSQKAVASPAMVELVMRMVDRMLEYEEEVRTGVRIPNSILEEQTIEAAKVKQREKRRLRKQSRRTA